MYKGWEIAEEFSYESATQAWDTVKKEVLKQLLSINQLDTGMNDQERINAFYLPIFNMMTAFSTLNPHLQGGTRKIAVSKDYALLHLMASYMMATLLPAYAFYAKDSDKERARNSFADAMGYLEPFAGLISIIATRVAEGIEQRERLEKAKQLIPSHFYELLKEFKEDPRVKEYLSFRDYYWRRSSR